jgi:glycosyltransferase A (GT-A) superfamily protein (DUF2064 family)
MASPAVVLFARSPEREAAAKRMRSGARLFRAVVAAWLRAARRHGALPLIACAPEDRAALAAIAPEIERGWIEQHGATFGIRVANAAEDAFARGHDAVVLAAIDAPPHGLGATFAALARGVAVLAPAADGGVNYLGITSADRTLLEDLTTRRCREHFAELLVIETITDLDSPHAITAACREKPWRGLIASIATIPEVRSLALRGETRTFHTRPPPSA